MIARFFSKLETESSTSSQWIISLSLSLPDPELLFLHLGIGITVIPADGKVVVNRILEDGPAARLHVLQPRDEIVIANSQPVTGVEMLSEIVRQSPDSVTLIVKPYVHRM